MAIDMSEAILQLEQERNMPEDLILKTIEDTLLAAYKRSFGSVDSAVVRFDGHVVSIYGKKKVVDRDGVYEPWSEIDLDEARELNPEAEIGDEMLIEIDPRDFDRLSVQSAKQTARQSIRDIQKDTLHAEFKDKVGDLIVGYVQRERNGNLYIDLGKLEAVLPRRYQSPKELYKPGDRIQALIREVNRLDAGLQIVLTRSDTDFVKAIFEKEVPEVYDRTVEIMKIVRQPGIRTKLAVRSSRVEVDPVGACVGLKGVRILAVIKELEGEKIDVIKYDPDPRRFIKSALSPAEVRDVIILDESKKQALAVVADSQLSLAIGKQGVNVRLANRLVDWSIDVKTVAQFAEMDPSTAARRAAAELFGELDAPEEYALLSELPGIDAGLVQVLQENGLDDIETFLTKTDEELSAFIAPEQVEGLKKLIDEYVEVVEEEAPGEVLEEGGGFPAEEAGEVGAAFAAGAGEEAEAEDLVCPECGEKITVDMTACPNCGIGLSFEFEEE